MYISHPKNILFSSSNLLGETLWNLDRPVCNILASSDVSSWQCAMQILSCFQRFLPCPWKSSILQMQSHYCTCGVDFFLLSISTITNFCLGNIRMFHDCLSLLIINIFMLLSYSFKLFIYTLICHF